MYMNNLRRKKIKVEIDSINICIGKLENILSEEEEYLDSVPENLQNSERYEENCESYDNFEDLLDDLSSTTQELEEIYN